MIIKKKDVLLESLLIDKTNEFDKQEKRLLKVIHDKFGMGSGKIEKSWDFNKWDAAAYLIEFFEVPYDVAHNLTSTYYWNGDKLFKEYEPLRRKDNRSDIFLTYVFRDLLDPYIKNNANEDDNFVADSIEYTVKTKNEDEFIPNIKTYNPDARSHSEYEEGIREINEIKVSVNPLVWSTYNGIMLYIQPTEDSIIEPKNIKTEFNTWDTLRNMGFHAAIRLEAYKEDEKEKNQNYIKGKCEYTFGGEIKYSEVLWEEDIKLPEVFSKQNVYEFIEMLIEKCRNSINGLTFIYGKGNKSD